MCSVGGHRVSTRAGDAGASGRPRGGAELETPVGRFRLFTWRSTIDAPFYIALCAGEVGP